MSARGAFNQTGNEGAFSQAKTRTGSGSVDSGYYGYMSVSMSAQQSNSLYGNTEKIQIPAIQVLMIIKVWNADGCTTDEFPYISLDLSAEKVNAGVA